MSKTVKYLDGQQQLFNSSDNDNESITLYEQTSSISNNVSESIVGNATMINGTNSTDHSSTICL
jgi:hypothetical protein